MTTYCLELYDKDSDVADVVAYSDDYKKLQTWGRVVELLVKRDMVVRHCSDGTKEPYDTCRVRALAYEEEPQHNIYF